MSVWLPHLPSERLTRALPSASAVPLALLVREGGREIVVSANTVAAEAGIRAGQSVAAARALVGSVHFHAMDPAADRAVLENLATTLLRFTPDVGLDGSDALMMEIGRTAFHFGDEYVLARTVGELLARLGFAALCGIADTPMAARAMARAPGPSPHHAGQNAVDFLRTLPRRVLPLSIAVNEACRLLGLKTVGDLLDLPRHGLAARFGDDLLDMLDRMTGRRDEPIRRFEPPSTFSSMIEWWPGTADLGSLCFAAKRLFDLVEAHLAVGDRGAVAIKLGFGLEGVRDPFEIVLRPSRPASKARVLLDLMRHRLEAESLPAPAEKITLELVEIASLKIEQLSLFCQETPSPWNEVGAQLCDRLVGRLGNDRVLVPELTDEHRPEKAFLWRRPSDRSASTPTTPTIGRRPLEIDQPPLVIDIESNADGHPQRLLGGLRPETLRHVRGPERIEAGWWDGHDARRLYFEIETTSGAHLWIYHDLDQNRWFRHGVFA